MSDNGAEVEQLRREVAYYRRQLDELAGENIRQDYTSSGLVHQLRQKRQGFAILFDLQLSFDIETPLETIHQMTLRSINATLEMDRSLVLIPDEEHFRVVSSFGFETSGNTRLESLKLSIDSGEIGESGLLVNSSTPETPLITLLRQTVGLPYFVCVPVSVGRRIIALLVAGRLKEARPFRPPLDRGDADTMHAIAGLISTSVQNKNLASEVAERSRIMNLFGQQVSQAIVDEIVRSGSDPLSSRRQVCIMFLDIRNFTPMCELREPEEVVDFLNDLFAPMIETVNRHHGIINTFLGDGFMATFGAPVSHDNDCRNAIDASLEILEELVRLVASGSIPPTRIGIGIHAGEAVTGNVGSAMRKQYTVTGNTVILSSRIEQLTKQYDAQILVSDVVLTSSGYPLDRTVPLGPVQVKGRSEPISLFKIV